MPQSTPRWTRPVRFVEETGVDALAIMVGTAHGQLQAGAGALPLTASREIRAGYGGAGAARRQRCAGRSDSGAVKAGIRKINFGTDVCCALLDASAEPAQI